MLPCLQEPEEQSHDAAAKAAGGNEKAADEKELWGEKTLDP